MELSNMKLARYGPRHSILDLAPLELDCMNALWPLGKATVRDVQQALAPTRPRAYTTIMTILDRLAQKGVVTRQKAGRAWVYRPDLSAEQARSHAVSQVVQGFFEGSAEALAMHLSAQGHPLRLAAPDGTKQRPSGAPRTRIAPRQEQAEAPVSTPKEVARPRLDTSLL
jgi:BlaI family transcriptional regulator, penicillinase repressor